MSRSPSRTVRLTPTPPDRPPRSVATFSLRADGARTGRILTPLPSSTAVVVPEQDIVGAAPSETTTRFILFHESGSSGGTEYVRRMRYGQLDQAAVQFTVEALDGPHLPGALWADADRLDAVLDAWTWVLSSRAEGALTRLHSALLREFHARRPLTGRRTVLAHALERFLEHNGGVQGSLLVELLTDLWAWHTLEHARTLHGPDRGAGGAAQAVERIRQHCGRRAHTAAANVWSGYLATLRGDRVACAAAFDRARRQDRTGRFLENFTLRGLHTYAIGAAPDHAPVAADTAFDAVQMPDGGRGPTLVYAGDVKFFRRYFPRLHFHGRLLRRAALHFHVVGPRSEVDLAFADARSLATATDRTAADGRACRWGLSTEELPALVADPVTYYACVRFVRHVELLNLYPDGLWIQDLDLVQTGPIEHFFDRLVAHDIGVVHSSAGFGCTPWKSVLGGNVWVAGTSPARRFIQDAVLYMEGHWNRSSAWMLDQNALRYASDQVGDDCRVLDLADLRLPLNQNGLSALIET